MTPTAARPKPGERSAVCAWRAEPVANAGVKHAARPSVLRARLHSMRPEPPGAGLLLLHKLAETAIGAGGAPRNCHPSPRDSAA